LIALLVFSERMMPHVKVFAFYMIRNSLTMLVAISLTLTNGCSLLDIASASSPRLYIVSPEQDRIRFSGKGAGAGMMLMSSMGPAGIAIGVAIDEGISKEIHTAFSAHHTFSSLAEHETHSWLDRFCGEESTKANLLCNADKLTVQIERYGFKTTSGDNDPVVSDIEINFSFSDKQYHVKNAENISTSPLEEVKKNGDISYDLFQKGIQSILDGFEQQLLDSKIE
tara:strand:- start:9050 stop:9724 length:675 start_codon:yes stop_codon:yes gene_type:complete